MNKYLIASMLVATPMVAITTVARTTADEVGAYIIRGQVVAADGTPLVGATVRVPGTTRSVGTNSKGEFELTIKQGGTHDLLVTHIGYATQSVKAQAGGAAVNVTLQPSTDLLNEAVVTGTRVERALKDVPVITRVISQAEIEQINPQNFTNLLQYALPGIQFKTAHGSGLTSIIYQGMSSKQLAFLIDGERVNGEGATNEIDFNRINVDEIERIEVVRGAASTFYDSNAQAGVINIITKRGRRPIDANLTARYSDTYGEKYSANFGVNRKGWSSYTTFGWRQSNSSWIYDKEGNKTETVYRDSSIVSPPAPGDTMQVQGYRILDLSQRFTYDITDNLSAEAKVSYHANRPSAGVAATAREKYEDFIIGLKLHHLINENHRLDYSFQHDRYTKSKVFFANDSTIKTYRNDQHTFRLNYTGVIGRSTLGVGTEFINERLLHYYFAGKGGNEFSETRWALYAQNDWSIIDGLNLVVGARTDKGQDLKMHFTPKVSVLYRPVQELTFRINYSDGYRMPFLKERKQDYRPFAAHPLILGNDSLRPETSRMFSASVEYNKEGLNLTLSAFRNTYKNLIGYVNRLELPTGVTVPPSQYSRYMVAQYQNLDEKNKTTGIEVTARYRTLWGLGVNAAYNYVDDHKDVNGYNTSTVRPHTLTFGADYRKKIGDMTALISFNGHWGSAINSYTYVAQSRTNPTEYYRLTRYDARTYCTLNLSAIFPHGIKAGFMIENLFDYRDKAISATVQRPDLGRNFVASLSINLADAFGW